MSSDEVAKALLSDASVIQAINSLSVEATAKDLSINSLDLFQPDYDWFHLLRCASIFLDADTERCFEVGLRIIHSCFILDAGKEERAFAAALLAKISSNPSLKIATKRSLIPEDVLQSLPFPLSLEVAAHQISSTISIDTPYEFVGNDFQVQLWRALEQYDWVSASAPTSAGKSYALEKWIEHAVKTKANSTVFYIVPTRALISQVQNDLQNIFGDNHPDIAITSLPLTFSARANHNIHIYTQERFHLYLLNHETSGEADLIVIDEAQQIGASRRGILLQQVLELSAQIFPTAKVLFASPSTENPERLLEFAPKTKRVQSIVGQKPTVNQNLIWVEQVRNKPADWTLNLMSADDSQIIGKIKLLARPSATQKLPFIAHEIGKNTGGNVIYVNRAADAEATAEIICQLINEETDDPEILALSELCEKAVHPKFKLRRFVKKGVAFHYGNIPQLIRSEVERLFTAGKIQYLVCTSTLVEGVNLSCRNIFMRKPKRGGTDLMSTDDFWNLAGRAGRWGKEFQGNIYCIDPLKPNEWINGTAPRTKQKHKISLATQRLDKEFNEFVEYIETSSRQSTPPNRFHEHLFSYLIFRQTEHGSLTTAPSLTALSQAQVNQIEKIVLDTINNLDIPPDVILRNPGINPWGLNALYEHFMEKQDSDLEGLLPTDPLNDAHFQTDSDEREDSAVSNLIAIFSRISKYLDGKLGSGQSAFGNALLVLNWMRGYPLSRIIDSQLRYWTKRDAKKKDTAIIRETMERIERIARFETPKYLHAYLDILHIALRHRGRADLVPKENDFWLYLEFGVSKRTQISLMSLGLSRSSVTELSDYLVKDDLTEEECLSWFKNNNWSEFGLSQLVELEITTLLKRHNN
jgi:hypothetical protein